MDEERAYRYWITHHRHGFVLEGRHRPKFGHFMLHRATCAELKSPHAKRTHETTGGRMKACATDRAQQRPHPAARTHAYRPSSADMVSMLRSLSAELSSLVGHTNRAVEAPPR